jgi:tRNA-Thr(GGU) m(6)t(6)A37 methyltransferase TsaA
VSITMEAIGTVHSCYKEKFAIPRQPGLVEAPATIELLPPYNDPQTVRGLEQFSHLWIIFIFHAIEAGRWSPTVRPPRLGGNTRVGVFASRSTHRPNPVGLSVVALEGIDAEPGRVALTVRGADLLDGTPVVDIKPYIPYADSVAGAVGGFAPQAPQRMAVLWSPEALAALPTGAEGEEMRRVIEEALAYDPRPAYRRGQEDGRRYGVHLFDFNVRWRVAEGVVRVDALEALTPPGEV